VGVFSGITYILKIIWQIAELHGETKAVETRQKRLDRALNMIRTQQGDIDALLQPIEQKLGSDDNVASADTFAYDQQTTQSREDTYALRYAISATGYLLTCVYACRFALADSLNSQLESIRLQIQKMIGKLNKGDSAQANDEPDDPVAQIAQVLDEQMASLQWIEGLSGLCLFVFVFNLCAHMCVYLVEEMMQRRVYALELNHQSQY
jgi:hypothetical protein